MSHVEFEKMVVSFIFTLSILGSIFYAAFVKRLLWHGDFKGQEPFNSVIIIARTALALKSFNV